MPTGGLPEKTLKEVRYRGIPFQVGKYRYVGSLFHRKDTNATKHKSHNVLGAELKVLIRHLKPGTRASKKALAMQRDLKGRRVSGLYITAACVFCFFVGTYPATAGRVEKNKKHLGGPPSYNTIQLHNIEDEESNPTVEELTFDPHIATLLLPYRRFLEEMRNHYVEQESQRGRHLSNILKWSVVEHSLSAYQDRLLTYDVSPGFKRWLERLWRVHIKEHYIIDTVTALTAITSVISYSSIPCRGPGSKPSENHIKSQIRYLCKLGISSPNPGNGGSGSARSDFAAVVFNGTDQQFPFFIVEFETDGFSVHKDEIVVAAEAAFEYNRILAAAHHLSEDEVNALRLHIGLINGTTIHLGSMKPIYDEEKKSLIYAYEINNITFNIPSSHNRIDH
ncbi:8372_t:CDS:2 [Ambispora gerdemannii]|uniref:8372_t:CDS:1 n=1 Tax=Ambispora gerdemannii TaxID=144530 RepID=A0A9N9D4W7_9GLOM|nr:8372_t:CDS:2 [Ambispora gerdemannii]